ncbi:hypothetical protein Sps_03478 [Shewanella psychrophila]|uniref:Uncharacterized protein n=1 Tax=Shewanella psychrophila TaxID=225848 RepID=A0A1S6HSV7_9GAMM|nr:hypothetical protein Sps_03478 [Shewanella psychrophila]
MKNSKSNVVSALCLKNMKVLRIQDKVITIDKPSKDFQQRAVEIIENIKGIRCCCNAVQFAGFCIRWNEDK